MRSLLLILFVFCVCMISSVYLLPVTEAQENSTPFQQAAKTESNLQTNMSVENQNSNELFSFAGTSKEGDFANVSPAAVREQNIDIKFDALISDSSAKIRIPLLDGKTYEAIRAEREGLVLRGMNDYTWRGYIDGKTEWSVTLSVKDGALSGLIYSTAGVYEIVPQAEFKHVLVKLDQSRYASCGGGIPAKDLEAADKDITTKQEVPFAFEPPTKNLFETRKNYNPIMSNRQSSTAVDNGSQIDVMIVYTAFVRGALGGTTQTQAFAQQAVASANTVYQNSGIATRLRLVQTMEVNYADNGNGQAGLNWVTNDPAVAAARNSSKADLVSILTENATDLCGIAWIMGSVNPSFESRGFSLVQRSCAIGGLTFAHELGHNQACDHNPENGNPASSLAFPYAYGHWSAGANFRTIMSYPDPCPGCARIAYFSNPSFTYNGIPIGVANQRDNTRVINNTALTISQFRDSGGGCVVTPISAGQTINASLTTPDCAFAGTTRYVDIYNFNGTTGQRVAVSMNSSAFDTYLYLVNSSSQILAEDDDGGGGGNSRIPAVSGYFTLPATGTYTIWATSYSQSSTGAYTLNLSLAAATTHRAFDFDGDGRADISVFRPSTGVWSLSNTSTGYREQQFAAAGDRMVPADYDGDGRTDIAVYRPANGRWYLSRSSAGYIDFQFGINGDIPVPSDYDGDGKVDAAVYRPSNGMWYMSRSLLGYGERQFGGGQYKPVLADYDGDGKTDIAVYLPSNGVWYILRSSLGYVEFQFGGVDYQPVVADYDGDGKADVAVYRPSNGVWYLSRSQSGYREQQFGGTDYQAVPADYDGDGKTDIAIYRPSNGVWYLLQSTAGYREQQFGGNGFLPIVSAYIP